MFFRKLAIRALFPITWRPSPRRRARGLQRFAVTELDSAWQILHALDAVDEPKLRAKMLQHALEELHHAAEFDRVSRGLVPAQPPRPFMERAPIFDPDAPGGALAAFAAYAHVGEVDVFDQFSAYAAGIGDGEARGVFREARLDERGHAGMTWDILVEATGDERAARRLVWRTRGRRAYEAWLRFSKSIGEVTTGLLLTVLYAIFGALFALPARRRLEGPNA